jgi:hydrazine synthase alpha subunit-like protein
MNFPLQLNGVIEVMRLPTRALAMTLAATALVACSSGGNLNIGKGQSSTGLNVDFGIAYIKRTIPATAADATELAQLRAKDDVRLPRNYWSQADVYLRTSATPTGTEENITASVTGSATSSATGSATATNFWDVKDLDISPDATQLIFAMRGPITPNQKDFAPPSWHIWQYTVSTKTLTQLTGTSIDTSPNAQDVDPHYLSDGRIVFSSTRQTQSREVLINEGGVGENVQPFEAQTESQNTSDFLLMVMNSDGTGIHQISFNPSHDLNSYLLANGRVVFTRWDDTVNRTGGSGMHIYSVNPDGTDVQLLYGAQSHTTSSTNPSNAAGCPAGEDCAVQFMLPRPLQDGRLLTLVRPFAGADFGGNLAIIDTNDFVENNQAVPDTGYPTSASALMAATQNNVATQTVNGVPVPSPGGRFNSAFPLWDGTNRVLVSWNQCRLQDKTGTLMACTDANLANANSAAPTLTLAPPLYSAWLLNFNDSTLKPVFLPVEGVMISDLVSLQPRTVPCTINASCPVDSVVPATFDPSYGIVDIRSVYDRDGLGAGLGANANLSAVAVAPAANRPARFLRFEKFVAVGDPDLKDGFPKFDANIALSGSVGYMRQLLGYVPIEPDGSARVMVPANVAFQITVLDANAQALPDFPRHTAWLTVQPGEVLSCNGCHTPQPANVITATDGTTVEVSGRSHGRAQLFTALNNGDGATFTAPGNGTVATMSLCPGATMAQELVGSTSCNNSPTAPYSAAAISQDVIFNDAWGDGNTNPTGPNAPISLTYGALTTNLPIVPSCQSVWSGFCLSIINYPTIIDPLWSVVRGSVAVDPRGANTCTNCHTATRTNTVGGATVPVPPDGNLQLDADPAQSATAQLRAYTQLVDTHDVLSLNATNQLVDSGVTVPGSIAAGSASGSCFFRTITGAQLGCSVTGTVNHAGFMTAAELRLLSEWVDIGAQYYNNPFDAPLAN